MEESKELLPEKAFRTLVKDIGHHNAEFIKEPSGIFRIENTEGEGILGLGFDGKNVWLCPTQSSVAFNRNNGWNANDRIPLYGDDVDPEMEKEFKIEIARIVSGDTEYRFLEDHFLYKFLKSFREVGRLIVIDLHVAVKSDWSDEQVIRVHRGMKLVAGEECLMAGPIRGSGYAEMKLSISGLNVVEWNDAGWKIGAKQILRMDPK